MKTRYYLINKAQRAEYNGFKKKFDSLGKRFYLQLLRYCKEREGKVVNLAFGERMAESFSQKVEESIRETENSYKYLVALGTEDGLFMVDLTPIGIDNFTQLINFLKAKTTWIIEDDKGRKITKSELIQLAKVKGLKPHYKEALNLRTANRIRRAITNLKQSLRDVKEAIESTEDITSRNEELLEIEEKLIAALKILDEVESEDL